MVGFIVIKDQLRMQIFLIHITLCLAILPSTAQELTHYLVQIELRDTRIDKSLPDSISASFEDYDDTPLRSVSFDLNGDGVKEKFVPNPFLSGTGGCPWVIYDVKTHKLIGEIGGAVIYIQKKKNAGYAILESYWHYSATQGTVSIYKYKGGSYQETNRTDIQDETLDEYFSERQEIPHVKQNHR